jgi:DNA-directed RNA polymerase subunit RPC12/RpoP
LEENRPEINKDIVENCPHCGHKLSPWQQVLLNVDRALTCKNCWYRIILDVPVKSEPESSEKNNKPKG